MDNSEFIAFLRKAEGPSAVGGDYNLELLGSRNGKTFYVDHFIGGFKKTIPGAVKKEA